MTHLKVIKPYLSYFFNSLIVFSSAVIATHDNPSLIGLHIIDIKTSKQFVKLLFLCSNDRLLLHEPNHIHFANHIIVTVIIQQLSVIAQG